jgi:hypothetical protein
MRSTCCHGCHGGGERQQRVRRGGSHSRSAVSPRHVRWCLLGLTMPSIDCCVLLLQTPSRKRASAQTCGGWFACWVYGLWQAAPTWASDWQRCTVKLERRIFAEFLLICPEATETRRSKCPSQWSVSTACQYVGSCKRICCCSFACHGGGNSSGTHRRLTAAQTAVSDLGRECQILERRRAKSRIEAAGARECVERRRAAEKSREQSRRP